VWRKIAALGTQLEWFQVATWNWNYSKQSKMAPDYQLLTAS